MLKKPNSSTLVVYDHVRARLFFQSRQSCLVGFALIGNSPAVLQDAETVIISDEIARFHADRSSSSGNRLLSSNESLFQDPLARFDQTQFAVIFSSHIIHFYSLSSTLDFVERSALKHDHGYPALQRGNISYDGNCASASLHLLRFPVTATVAALKLRLDARRSQMSADHHHASGAALAPPHAASSQAVAVAPLASPAGCPARPAQPGFVL